MRIQKVDYLQAFRKEVDLHGQKELFPAQSLMNTCNGGHDVLQGINSVRII